MQTKKCSLCQEVKPSTDFYISGKYLYSHCKTCKKEKDKNTYHTNEKDRESRKTRDKKSNRIRRLKAMIFVYGILSQSKCIDCGESRLETLDFDHVNGIKERNISSMLRKGLPVITIEKEISKCEVRCASCHRIKTFKQLGWARSNWNIEEAKLELANCLQEVPTRKPAHKRRSKKLAGKH